MCVWLRTHATDQGNYSYPLSDSFSRNPQQPQFATMVRGDAYFREEITNTRMACFYNRKVKERPLKEGDLVLRKMKATGKGTIQGKFTPN